MAGSERNRFRYKDWIFQPIERNSGSYDFNCGAPEINKFFMEDFFVYEELLVTKTYELSTEEIISENLPPLGFISFCNDAAKIEKNIKEFVPRPEEKHFQS